MSLQKLHALEKTAIQARHAIKRLDNFIETSRDDKEKLIAEQVLSLFKSIRESIPKSYRDVDLKDKE
jgi:hypothetical protein